MIAALIADLSFRLRPTNYFGGSTDDQRYLEAALAWMTQGPHAGTTHWALRHPLILSIVASFKAFGVSMEALQLVPRLYADLLIGMTAAFLARHGNRRVALLWVALALASPILHEMATSCFPEMPELAFGAASMWAFWEARVGGRRAGPLYAVSGVALAMAVLTRETSVAMLPLYAWAWWRSGDRWRGPLWFAAGFLPLIAIDIGWLWWLTGDPLYRLHVDESHIGIYSDHLRGGVYHGRVFLNPDLASRWLPSGPVRLHWAIDPLLNFIADPRNGLIFAAWALLAFAPPTRARPASLPARVMPVLLAVALLSYVIVTWVLTLRPQPRYYLFAVYAATIAVALLATRRGSRIATIIQRASVGLVLLLGIIVILLAPDRQRDARVILPWMARHPGTVIHLDRKDADRMAFPAALRGMRDRISGAPPAIGAVRARVIVGRGDPRTWQPIALLAGPRLFPYINPPRQIMIERRLR